MFYLYRLLDESLSPLDPDIPLIFGSGLLTGLVPSAARGNCTSWSPESGVLLDSNAGDYFPSFLRMNGFDHLVLYGQAPAWTLMMIREGVVTFEDASPYVGLDNIDMREAIARDIGGMWTRNLAMANITRAGENLVLTSGIMAGPKAIYARGGPGAKMGSLGLKAIVTHRARRASSRRRSPTSPTTATSRRSCSAPPSSRTRCRPRARRFSTSRAGCSARWARRTTRRRRGPTGSMPSTSTSTARAWKAVSAVP